MRYQPRNLVWSRCGGVYGRTGGEAGITLAHSRFRDHQNVSASQSRLFKWRTVADFTMMYVARRKLLIMKTLLVKRYRTCLLWEKYHRLAWECILPIISPIGSTPLSPLRSSEGFWYSISQASCSGFTCNGLQTNFRRQPGEMVITLAIACLTTIHVGHTQLRRNRNLFERWTPYLPI